MKRFWSKVDKRGAGGCWEWRAATTRDGYGLFRLSTSEPMKLAHRVAWFLTHGSWPTANLLHRCDNPRCVNVEAHLVEGTQSDNMKDCAKKGRLNQARGDASGRRLHPDRYTPVKGSQHGSARLCEADVLAIRELLRAGESQGAVARKYGVSQSSVSLIVLRKTWRHVP